MVTIWCVSVTEESGSVLASFLKIFGCHLDPEKGLGIFSFLSLPRPPHFSSLKRKERDRDSKEPSDIHTGNSMHMMTVKGKTTLSQKANDPRKPMCSKQFTKKEEYDNAINYLEQ